MGSTKTLELPATEVVRLAEWGICTIDKKRRHKQKQFAAEWCDRYNRRWSWLIKVGLIEKASIDTFDPKKLSTAGSCAYDRWKFLAEDDRRILKDLLAAAELAQEGTTMWLDTREAAVVNEWGRS